MAQHIINYKKPTPLNCKDQMFFNSCTIKGSEDIPEKLQQIVKKINALVKEIIVFKIQNQAVPLYVPAKKNQKKNVVYVLKNQNIHG